MQVDVVTKQDLEEFRLRLLGEIRLIFDHRVKSTQEEWLRSYEVKKLMKISTGTLQNLRISKKLNPTKIGGILMYKRTEIERLLQTGDGRLNTHSK